MRYPAHRMCPGRGWGWGDTGPCGKAVLPKAVSPFMRPVRDGRRLLANCPRTYLGRKTSPAHPDDPIRRARRVFASHVNAHLDAGVYPREHQRDARSSGTTSWLWDLFGRRELRGRCRARREISPSVYSPVVVHKQRRFVLIRRYPGLCHAISEPSAYFPTSVEGHFDIRPGDQCR
jgi:hypothetical protein